MNVSKLRQNVERVRQRIAVACERAERDPSAVRLVAVTKTVGADVARALVESGVTDIGENRIQEAARKQEALADLEINWHMIGHLQTNKAKDAVRMFHLIHSVDSVRLAEALNKRASAQGRSVPVLVEVNVSGEESKYGVPAAVAIDQVRSMAKFPAIQVRGLMTMPPLVDDPEQVRPLFVRLRRLAAEIKTLGMAGVEMKHLSMGMTQDYEVAVEEGATFVRVGTALFSGI